MPDTAPAHFVAEKHSVAFWSVVAAVAMTVGKLIVGLMTNSLGMLSEALHSGLDLVAALVTLLTVRVSDRPADEEHLYGHGKFENLSALFETVLLLATCVWVVKESIERLIDKNVEVQATWWAFGVMLTSIALDLWRSRALRRAADKYQSQALEADALHFSTDVWSSAVVILGLIGVRLAGVLPEHANTLIRADAVAALGVAVIIVLVSIRLGRRTLRALLDTAPAGLKDRIQRAVEALPRVVDCHQIRVRTAGPNTFVECHILVDGGQTLQEAHELTDRVERCIHELAPGAEITVHPEPR